MPKARHERLLNVHARLGSPENPNDEKFVLAKKLTQRIMATFRAQKDQIEFFHLMGDMLACYQGYASGLAQGFQYMEKLRSSEL